MSVVGARGEKTSVYKGEYWCDVVFKTGWKLKEPKISFKTTSSIKKTPSMVDTVVSDGHRDVITPTVAQSVCLDKWAGIKRDENEWQKIIVNIRICN